MYNVCPNNARMGRRSW